MKRLFQIFCWLTLYVDACLLLGNYLTGSWGNTSVRSVISTGSMEVTSAMPGGAAFIGVIAIWTGLLAGCALWHLGREMPKAHAASASLSRSSSTRRIE
jgi:hypothetical protein